MSKLIFNGLGPGRSFRYNGTDYKDGQIIDVIDSSIEYILRKSAYVVDATDNNVLKVRKLLSSADKKRNEILKKFQDLSLKQNGSQESTSATNTVKGSEK